MSSLAGSGGSRLRLVACTGFAFVVTVHHVAADVAAAFAVH